MEKQPCIISDSTCDINGVQRFGINTGLMLAMKRFMMLRFQNSHIWRFCVSL
jgi:hypothetical protein